MKSPTQQDLNPANATLFTYAAGGQVASSVDAVGSKTTYGYDTVGRLTSMVSPRGNVSGATPADFSTTFVVDGYGAPTTITAPATAPVTQVFDANHQLTSVTGPDGNTTTTTYDGAGRVTATTRAAGTGLAQVTATAWWPDSTLKSTTDPASNVTSYTYDPVGRMVGETDPSGTRNYTYDTFDRVTAKQDPGGNCGANPKTGCTTFSYDNASQPQGVDYSDPATPDITASSYDPVGRPTGRTNSNGGTTAQSWDTLGRMTSTAVLMRRRRATGSIWLAGSPRSATPVSPTRWCVATTTPAVLTTVGRRRRPQRRVRLQPRPQLDVDDVPGVGERRHLRR